MACVIGPKVLKGQGYGQQANYCLEDHDSFNEIYVLVTALVALDTVSAAQIVV